MACKQRMGYNDLRLNWATNNTPDYFVKGKVSYSMISPKLLFFSQITLKKMGLQ